MSRNSAAPAPLTCSGRITITICTLHSDGGLLAAPHPLKWRWLREIGEVLSPMILPDYHGFIYFSTDRWILFYQRQRVQLSIHGCCWASCSYLLVENQPITDSAESGYTGTSCDRNQMQSDGDLCCFEKVLHISGDYVPFQSKLRSVVDGMNHHNHFNHINNHSRGRQEVTQINSILMFVNNWL